MNNQEKQYEAENKFKDFLDSQKIPYWYIQQDIDSYAKVLKEYNVQRPDFFVLLPHFGFILVDVEHKEPLEKYEKFCISLEETNKYTNLQKYFNISVWYAFSNEKIHYSTWYFIPMTKVQELKEQFLVRKKGYISTPIQSFTQLSMHENISKLFQAPPKTI
ncbi:hypothetical protein HZA98_02455 [Candidatus Woesearchaeota archaeon]|nr:hypothetical protein [Candidatus Woesearchaeota archaeon]